MSLQTSAWGMAANSAAKDELVQAAEVGLWKPTLRVRHKLHHHALMSVMSVIHSSSWAGWILARGQSGDGVAAFWRVKTTGFLARATAATTWSALVTAERWMAAILVGSGQAGQGRVQKTGRGEK